MLADDRTDILDLDSRMIHSFDHGEDEVWLGCFTPDAVIDLADGTRFEGYESLRRYRIELNGAAPLRHTPATHWIQGDAARATMRSYFTMASLSDPSRLLSAGRFEDQLEKVDGEWKFKERRVITVWRREV